MISASIVTYHTPQSELDRCIACLQQSPLVSSVSVIDNSVNNVGYGAGHNKAIRQSAAKYHLVINSDVTFEPGTLEFLFDYMERHTDVGQCIPRTLNPDGSVQHVCRLLPTPFDLFVRRFLPPTWLRQQRQRYTLAFTGYDHEMNVPYHMGCFMFFRRSALDAIAIRSNSAFSGSSSPSLKVQYFDERFFLYPEDIDITRRMHRLYRTMFVPDVTIVHQHRQSSYHSLRLMCVHIYNMCKYFNKWGWLVDDERKSFNQKCLTQNQ